MKTFLQPLTAREEREYLERYKEGDQEARAILINRNMRLVAHVIKKYQCSDYEMEDLLSVGTIGLIKAVNTFDMDKGSRLATYAAKCVENAILTQMRFFSFVPCKKRSRCSPLSGVKHLFLFLRTQLRRLTILTFVPSDSLVFE